MKKACKNVCKKWSNSTFVQILPLGKVTCLILLQHYQLMSGLTTPASIKEGVASGTQDWVKLFSRSNWEKYVASHIWVMFSYNHTRLTKIHSSAWSTCIFCWGWEIQKYGHPSKIGDGQFLLSVCEVWIESFRVIEQFQETPKFHSKVAKLQEKVYRLDKKVQTISKMFQTMKNRKLI